MTARLLTPGGLPPTFTCFCEYCQLPVERLAVDVVTSPYYALVQAQCCGKTSGRRVSHEEIFRLRVTNQKLFIVTKKGNVQGFSKLSPMALKWERFDAKDLERARRNKNPSITEPVRRRMGAK